MYYFKKTEHGAYVDWQGIQKWEFELWAFSEPAYWPNYEPSDYHLFQSKS